MKEKTKGILFGIFALALSVAWFTVYRDWELLLFHFIPLNNVVAGIIFAIVGVLSLIGAFGSDDKKDSK